MGPSAADFYDPWVDLYDRMIDWDARLAREGPALAALLGPPPRRVLDVACGTGRHLAWLAGAGYDVAGADASAGMLARARASRPGDQSPPLFEWAMAGAVPAALAALGPFDAVLCLGNSFPHVIDDADVSAALGHFRSLLAPGGLLVLGLKALAVLRDARRPFLPLVKRRVGGQEVLFVRFYDFQTARAGSADFHLVILAPGPVLPSGGGVHHSATPLRVWRPDELGAAVRTAGLAEVIVARDLSGALWQPGDGEDIFVTGRWRD